MTVMVFKKIAQLVVFVVVNLVGEVVHVEGDAVKDVASQFAS